VGIRASQALNRQAVCAATKIVAGHCAQRGLPFEFVIQGLGEPTMCWDDLHWCVEVSRTAATAAGVPWRGHLSTNGQIHASQAKWIAEIFNHVTISCDGPPDIQDVTRPQKDGLFSHASLPETADIIRSGRTSLETRVTITNTNAGSLPEVIRYIVEDLGIRAIRLEPIFAQPRHIESLPAPEELARCCMEACEAGNELDAEVYFASPRLTQLHGEYCESLRQTLRLSPDGTAVNCLHGVGDNHPRGVAIGHYEEATGRFRINEAVLVQLRATAEEIPSGCVNCVNIYHCARTCPDACPTDRMDDSYRCRFQQYLAEAWILRGTALASRCERHPAVNIHVKRELRKEVNSLPMEIDRQSILAEAQAALIHYAVDEHAMPSPAWANEELCLNGTEAVETLLSESRRRTGAISVYVHLPFCQRKCSFCDCHSVVVRRESVKAYSTYITCLSHDLDTWCTFGGMDSRPVTTIHFGGGTPNVIGQPLLAEFVQILRSRLTTTQKTEWAIESTSDNSSPESLDGLLELGFRRLHIGVQTLYDDLRQRLGRVNRSEVVIERLRSAMAMGMVTSVDMLYGLPNQTARILLDDLTRLTDIGIHGVSLYRLNLSSRNRALLQIFPGFCQRPLAEYVMLQAAEQMFYRAGYGKNHYTHYALSEDGNRYFRHAIRGEDLLAIGASASGSIGPWEYLSERFPKYLRRDGTKLPIIAIGKENIPSDWLKLAAWVMAGWIPDEVVPGEAYDLISCRWLPSRLITPEDGGFRLTATGAWMLTAMLDELHQEYKHCSENGDAWY
jgi:coproporphyrinogen III oxidase-like Fe-S oxidoreductase/sulfatase maturation enzyme AslB (radical SAM superfamily)